MCRAAAVHRPDGQSRPVGLCRVGLCRVGPVASAPVPSAFGGQGPDIGALVRRLRHPAREFRVDSPVRDLIDPTDSPL